MYRSYRNEAVHLRTLLLAACTRLAMYGIEMPAEVAKWWKAQKALLLMGRIKKAEFGVLQQAIAAEEQRQEALSEGDND